LSRAAEFLSQYVKYCSRIFCLRFAHCIQTSAVLETPVRLVLYLKLNVRKYSRYKNAAHNTSSIVSGIFVSRLSPYLKSRVLADEIWGNKIMWMQSKIRQIEKIE
jgi:hypothetical protein